MSVTTKIYKNTTKVAINVVGIGEIAAGDQVSITGEHHQPVILANYPGVEEVTDVVSEDTPAAKDAGETGKE